jgi:hypothetical protein
MTIVSHDYRPKRARKRKQSPAIPMRIVTAKPPKPGKAAPAIADAVIEQKRPAARPATISGPRIVTAPRKTSTRFGPVQDLTPEEHQRRGDAAVELFKELARRAAWNAR